jgi:hypothetical protein
VVFLTLREKVMTTRKELDTFYAVLDSLTTSELSKFKKLIVASLKDKSEITDKGNIAGNPMFTSVILEAMGIKSKANISYWFSPEALNEISR